MFQRLLMENEGFLNIIDKINIIIIHFMLNFQFSLPEDLSPVPSSLESSSDSASTLA